MHAKQSVIFWNIDDEDGHQKDCRILCTCGLAFFGLGYNETCAEEMADEAFHEHIRLAGEGNAVDDLPMPWVKGGKL